MADEEQVRILLESVETWNQWRREYPGARIDLRRVDLWRANLDKANLFQANFRGADLREANLIGADLGEANFSEANLNEAKLGRANLCMANLWGANLRGAILSEADLSWADLWGADLSAADLCKAELKWANLRGAILREANLSGAGLMGANLSEARLWRTNLSGAIALLTVFGAVDLSDVVGLESVVHEGPSTVGTDTVYASGGRIPEAFLRGCGVPDELITYMRSLVGRPIEYHSCFISYSSKDQAFAERLHADLQAKGVRCWFAPHDLKIGDRFRQRIDEAIRLHDKLLLILSEHSVESDWVATEVEAAFEKERQRGQTVLFPVRIDDPFMTSDQAWAADIRRTRHIGDFTRWKDHDAYAKAFDRLVQDLKAEE